MTIKIESDIPIMPRRIPNSKYREAYELMVKMECGQSFIWHENTSIYRVAKVLGISVKTRKLDGTGYRVWRVA